MFIFFGATSVFACDFDDSDGLDVGLVLSGGGAKSSTQVGVMQIMDELDIPIHCISGTSMGAVVGSFYAAGYTADEIGQILTSEDWGALFRGDLPRTDKAFIQKEREETYFSGDIAGLKGGKLELPGGLNSMQRLKMLYRKLLSDVPIQIDFDTLGIPFRAIVTKLETGDAVAIKEGDLVEAILASMTVPGVFPPRIIDGVTYVDGAMSSNLPIKTVQDMGADIIIALDTTVAPRKSDGHYSVAETLQQLMTITIYKNVQQEKLKLSEDDLYIFSNIINLQAADYTGSAEGIEAGIQVGDAHSVDLLRIKALAAPPTHRKPSYVRSVVPTVLTVNNETSIDDVVITARLGKSINALDSVSDKDRRLRELASFGRFGEVDLGYNNGEAVLSVKQNALGKDRIKVGLNASSDFAGGSSYGILAQYTHQPIGRLGGDVSVSAEIGTDHGLNLEIYQPFGYGSRYFIQPEIYFRSDLRELDIFEYRLGDYRFDALGVSARLGREISSWGLVALEGEIKSANVTQIVTTDPEFNGDGDATKYGSVAAYFAIDTLNRLDWPTNGQRLQIKRQNFYDFSGGGAQDFQTFEASWLYAFEIDDIGVLLNARYGKHNSEALILGIDSTFELGGFRQLSSFRENSLPVEMLTYGSLEVFQRLSNTGLLLDFPVYVGGVAEFARIPLTFFGIDQVEDAFSGTLYIGSETPLGPAFIGMAYGNSNDLRFFFKFGSTF